MGTCPAPATRGLAGVRVKGARRSADPALMVRLLLGLVVACALLYGAYRGLRSDAPPPTAQQAAARREGVTLPASGPGAARAIVNDYQKIETQNRAALERTVDRAADTH